MPIDLEPIANFDASSATADQSYVVQSKEKVLSIVSHENNVWIDENDDEVFDVVAFALINPYVAPEASTDEPAGDGEASEVEAA